MYKVAVFDQAEADIIALCHQVAKEATCIRRKIGSVIVKDGRVLSTGYNGAADGILPCTDRGYCLRDVFGIPSGSQLSTCYAVHAEQRAILTATKYNIPIKDATLYVDTSPCSICVNMMISVGIRKVVVCGPTYPDEFAKELIKESNLMVRYIEE